VLIALLFVGFVLPGSADRGSARQVYGRRRPQRASELSIDFVMNLKKIVSSPHGGWHSGEYAVGRAIVLKVSST
jgi:hypothetical protein